LEGWISKTLGRSAYQPSEHSLPHSFPIISNRRQGQ